MVKEDKKQPDTIITPEMPDLENFKIILNKMRSQKIKKETSIVWLRKQRDSLIGAIKEDIAILKSKIEKK